MLGSGENHGLGNKKGPKDWKPWPKCEDCGDTLKPQILHTCAYYIGTQCQCGPNSRESDYFKTHAEAQKVLDSGVYGRV